MLLALPLVLGLFASQVAKGMRGVKPGFRQKILWFATPDANRAVLTGFSILVMGLALVMTLSRSGISCFLLALLLSAFQVMRHQATRGRRNWLVAYFVLVAIVSVGWAGFDAIAARFAEVDSQLGGRVGPWEDAWRIHGLFASFGTGFNTYGTATLFYQTHDLAAHYIEAHNDYLQLLTEGGYLVAVPAALLMVLFVRQVYRRFKYGNDDRVGYWIRLGATTGIVAMAFQEIVEFSLQMPGNAALFTVLCAIAMRKSSGGEVPLARTVHKRCAYAHRAPAACGFLTPPAFNTAQRAVLPSTCSGSPERRRGAQDVARASSDQLACQVCPYGHRPEFVSCTLIARNAPPARGPAGKIVHGFLSQVQFASVATHPPPDVAHRQDGRGHASVPLQQVPVVGMADARRFRGR